MAIRIPVEAAFNEGSIEQQLRSFEQKLNTLGHRIAQSNKTQFNPISKSTISDLQKVTQQFEALRRVSGDLNRRINATGQKGRGFLDLDWGALYPDDHSRNRQMAKAFSYVTGQSIVPPPPGPRHPPAGPTWQQVGVGAAQAGLRATNGATGGVGGVAANALGTGMSAGFGAGLMGLMGGLGALAVGKLVGAVTEKIEQAENNAVAYDKLKRTLGDVNISFTALKAAVAGTAYASKITFGESVRLSTQYARQGNLSGDQMRSLPGEVGLGVGFSRGYGLDPEAGVGMLGRMRGLGITRNEQETRHFALLIGETIGKSNAFAKADEVMDAIADFATMQTRNGMGAANVAGYAGMFSSLTSSGIPGLDPAGTGNLLARVNASLTAGGAKGEASQFFTERLGRRLGLDPFQTQVFREGGAFATKDEAFGPGSVWARYMGRTGPAGSATYMQERIAELRRAYGSDPRLLAQATANDFGVNMRQAMALLSTNPNQMGEMGKYADLQKLSGSGIGNLSKALYGSAAERRGLANSLYRRTGDDALSSTELGRLDAAMRSGNAETEKQVLAELVATRDQERTQGTDIRDSKNALENIKTALADRLIPLTQEIRSGIIYMAGGKDKMTTEQIMKEVIENDSRGRVAAINGKYDPQRAGLVTRSAQLRGQIEQLSETRLTGSAMYLGKPELVAQKRAERQALERELAENDRKIAELSKEKAGLLEKENKRRQQELDDMTEAGEARRKQEDAAREAEDKRRKLIEQSAGESSADRYGAAGGSSTGTGAPGTRSAAMKYFMNNGWSRDQAAGIVANLVAESGLRTSNVGDNGRAYGIAQWHPDRQADFAAWSGKNIRGSSFEEQLGFIQYELTKGKEAPAGRRLRGARSAREAGAIVSRYYERPDLAGWEVTRRGAMAERIGLTPMPDDARSALQASRPDSKGYSGPLSGEVGVSLDLSPEARRLLQGPVSMPAARIQQDHTLFGAR